MTQERAIRVRTRSEERAMDNRLKGFSIQVRRAAVAATVLALLQLAPPAYAQTFVSGSDGSDGSITFALPSGQTSWTFDFDPRTICAQSGVTCSLGASAQLDPDGDNVYHFTTFTMASVQNLALRLRGSRLRHPGPLVWLATGNVSLGGSVNLSGSDGHVGGQTTAIRGPSEPGPGGFPGGAGAKVGDVAQRGAGPGGGTVSTNSTAGCSAGHVVPGTPHARCANSGAAYGTTLIAPLIGGSGGSGGHFSVTNQGAGGGAGGGAIRITSAGTISLANYGIVADGGAPGAPTNGHYAGAGSGGAIHLQAPVVNMNTYSGWGLLARGAQGGHNGSAWEYSSEGRIRIDADKFNYGNGSAIPAALHGPLVEVPVPTTMPVVRVTSIGGIAVPGQPNNQYTAPDVSLDSASAVSLEVAAKNIPVGTVLRLHVTSEGTTGSADQVVSSSPLTGTLANSTATASVTLPQGVSRFYVRATW